MRTIAVSRNSMKPYLNELLVQLNKKLNEVCKNPSKPYFNHYLFESIAVSLQIAVTLDPTSASIVENSIFQISAGIFTQDVQEFLPYILQLLSLLIEYNPSNEIPQDYINLLTYIIQPALWEKTCNIRPLIRLLKAFIRKSPQQIIDSGRLEAILGIFQKLVASRMNDYEGLDLLQCLFKELPIVSLSNYVKDIFILLFKRLTESKTSKFVRLIIVFFSFFIYKFGPQNLEEVVDSIQNRMFGMVIEKLFIAESQKIEIQLERKIVCVGFTRLLCESNSIIEGAYSMFWPKLLEILIAVFELPVQDEEIQEEFTFDVDENLGYQAAYSKLVFAPQPQFDLFNGEIQDARIYLASNLHRLSTTKPGVLSNIINQNVDPQAVQHLNRYFAAANLSLS